MKRFKSDQIGRTMVEAMGYISVMIMITVSVAAAINRGYFKFRLGRVNQEITDLKKVIGQRWVADANYNDVKWETLVNEKIVPHGLQNGNNKNSGRHSFGGEVTIEGKDNLYWIIFKNIPKSACMELGLKTWEGNDGSDLNELSIQGSGSGAQKYLWSWPFSHGNKKCNTYQSSCLLPPTVKDVNDACTDNGNTITWSFD